MPRRPLSRRWTQEDSALLEKLLREGKDYHQIARRLKRSVPVIRGYARLMRSARPAGRAGLTDVLAPVSRKVMPGPRGELCVILGDEVDQAA